MCWCLFPVGVEREMLTADVCELLLGSVFVCLLVYVHVCLCEPMFMLVYWFMPSSAMYVLQ